MYYEHLGVRAYKFLPSAGRGANQGVGGYFLIDDSVAGGVCVGKKGSVLERDERDLLQAGR